MDRIVETIMSDIYRKALKRITELHDRTDIVDAQEIAEEALRAAHEPCALRQAAQHIVEYAKAAAGDYVSVHRDHLGRLAAALNASQQPPGRDEDGERFRWLVEQDEETFLQIGGQSFEMHELRAHIDAVRASRPTKISEQP